ncbi:MAG: apolipoprotein N-acyltransferase, partial [Ferruginibacter sp.]
MNKYQPLLLSLLSGILLFFAWPMLSFTVAIFFAFIPLFILEQKNVSRLHYFGFIYLAMFVWNITTTWWIWNSTMLGASLAIFVNSLFMCIPWMGFRYMNKKFGSVIGYSSIIIFWMSFEYLHLQDWGLSWPWLTLGNVFAGKTEWVQWYEYTGTSGGTLWILLVNVFLYKLFLRTEPITTGKRWLKSISVFLLIIIPLIISGRIINSGPDSEISNPNALLSNIVIVQPNIDPYEKVATGTFDAQLQKLIRLSESKIDSNTTLLVWPETAVYSGNGFDELNLKNNFFLLPLFAFLQRHPNLNLFTGI